MMHFTFILQKELCWPAITYARCAGQVAWVTVLYNGALQLCITSVKVLHVNILAPGIPGCYQISGIFVHDTVTKSIYKEQGI